MSLASAFDAAQVRRSLDALTPPGGPVLLGYSGGGDSHALLMIAAHWARETGRDLHAVIVDHGLRTESADEARKAQCAARDLGVEARIRRETPASKPASAIQQWARGLRQRLFAQAAGETGARTLLLGHTADDQAETVWMRLLAGGGDRALAAMSFDDRFVGSDAPDGLRIVRPLLDQRRSAIRDWLVSQGEDWIDDPSNLNRVHTRIRNRQTLARLEAVGFTPASLTGLAKSCHALNAGFSHQAARLFRHAVTLEAWGGASIDRPGFLVAPVRVQRRAMEAAIAAVTGQTGPVRTSGLDALMLGVKARSAASGAGCILHWDDSCGWLLRDSGTVLGREGIVPLAPISLESGETRIWDGRFAVASHLGTDAAICCLGQLDRELAAQCPGLSDIPSPARHTLPVIHGGGTLLAIPGVTDDPRMVVVHKGHDLARRSLFAGQAPAWFDAPPGQTVTQGSQYRG